jgi:hypothetical protein
MVQQKREETQYILVETNYCRDTNPTGQQACTGLQDRAYTQHELRDLVKQHDPCPSMLQLNVTLGVSGVIYKEFVVHMEKLGVRGPTAKSLARR